MQLIMKKTYLFLIFFTILNSIYCQDDILIGVVKDKKTKEIIPYVNIVYLEKNYGTTSDIKGEFKFPKLKEYSIIKISALGYKDSLINIEQLSNLVIFLEPEPFQLSEVTILAKRNTKSKLKFTGPFYNKHNSIWKRSIGSQIAILIQDESKIGSYIEKIKYQIKKDLDYDCHAYHRIRVLSNSNLNIPQKDIIDENIIINPLKFQSTVEVNISKYNLELPKEGIWICIEWIENPNCIDLHINNNNYVSPYLLGNIKLKKSLVYQNYRDRKWYKFGGMPNKEGYYINPNVGIVVREFKTN